MALADAYHGETLGALAVGGVDLYSELYKPLLLDVIRIEGIDCYRCKWGKCRDCCRCECFVKAEEAFKKYKDLALEIKAECTNDGVATTTKTFGDYPLTLITKNGKSVDCLMGYESEETVIELLRKYNIIK